MAASFPEQVLCFPADTGEHRDPSFRCGDERAEFVIGRDPVLGPHALPDWNDAGLLFSRGQEFQSEAFLHVGEGRVHVLPRHEAYLEFVHPDDQGQERVFIRFFPPNDGAPCREGAQDFGDGTGQRNAPILRARRCDPLFDGPYRGEAPVQEGGRPGAFRIEHALQEAVV